MFDPRQFIDETVDGATSTVSIPIPQGEFSGVIAEVSEKNIRRVETNDGTRWVLDLNWRFDDPVIVEVTKRKVNSARQTIWLDLTDDGKLDNSEGANVNLGLLRQSIGQNRPGQWSFRELTGVSGRCTIEHSQSADGSRTYANVTSVAAL